MKKILILQMRPENEAADSEFQAFLKVGGIPEWAADRIRVEQQSKMDINLDDYSAIIAGGSPFDVSLPEEKKSIIQKNVEHFFKDLFDKLIEVDFPFLGACSGNGLLGQYCGTPISGKFSERIGSSIVSMTENGKTDDLLEGMPEKFEVMVGHKEACDEVPEGSVLLLTSEACPVQMFRIKKNIYAMQFHPESDSEEFIVRVHIYKNYGYFAPEEAEDLIEAIKKIDTPQPKKILRRFIEKYGSFD